MPASIAHSVLRLAADADEQPVGPDLLRLAGPLVRERDGVEARVAVQCGHFGVRAGPRPSDARCTRSIRYFEPVLFRFSPRTTIDTRRAKRAKCIAAWQRRVSAADDEHVLVAAELGLAGAGAVVEARAAEAFLPLDLQLVVLDTGRADRGARDDPGAVLEHAGAHALREVAAHACARDENLGAEAVRLLARAVGEVRAADPVGEAEIVLDPGAAPRLAADGKPLDHDRLQPLRRGVDRRAQPGGPGAVDRQVVLLARGIVEPAELLADLADGGVLEVRAVLELAAHDPGARGRGPLERDVVAVQEIADRISLGRSRAPDMTLDRRLVAHPPTIAAISCDRKRAS